MAGVRDPAFWRRFSMAVHQDEEHKLAPHPAMAAPSSRPELKHTESWLERQQKKRKKVRYCAAAITLLVVVTIAGIAVLLWWLSRNGWFVEKDKKP